MPTSVKVYVSLIVGLGLIVLAFAFSQGLPDTSLCFGGGNSLYPMHAGFKFHSAICIAAAYCKDDFFHTAKPCGV